MEARFTLRSLAMVLVGCCLAVAAAAWAAEEPDAGGVVVVLTDGTALEAESVEREADLLIVHTNGGGILAYPVAEVDLNASRGLPPAPPATPQPAAAGSATGLAGLARGRSLTIPDEDPPRGGAPPSAARGDDPLNYTKGSADDDVLPTPPGSEPTPAPDAAEQMLRDRVAALQRQWRAYQQALGEVRDDCRGFTTGSGGVACATGGVIPRRDTAACQDAVRRARAMLPAMESAYTELWANGRRLQLQPGTVRQALNRGGFSDLKAMLRTEQARLDNLAH
jgi:hypothetical protein